MRRERLYLEDIIAAAAAILEFTRTSGFESFHANLLLRSAVLHQFTIIGEAASRISEPLRAAHPEVPWIDIKGFRNVIVHNYFGIDWEEVWRTATVRVPILREQIIRILLSEFGGGSRDER